MINEIRLIMSGHEWSCVVMRGHVWSCVVMKFMTIFLVIMVAVTKTVVTFGLTQYFFIYHSQLCL